MCESRHFWLKAYTVITVLVGAAGYVFWLIIDILEKQ